MGVSIIGVSSCWFVGSGCCGDDAVEDSLIAAAAANGGGKGAGRF